MSAIYQHIKITLTAGEARDIAVAGSYLRLLSNSITTNPYVRIGQNPEQIIKAGLGVKLADGQKFGLVTFRNPHATDPMTLEIASGDGLIDDASLVISGTVITEDTNSDDIKTAVEATKLNSDDIKTASESVLSEIQGAAAATAWDYGTVGTTQEQLAAANSDRKLIRMKAHPDNTDRIYIGYDDTVASNKAAYLIEAGEAWEMDGAKYRGAVHIIGGAAGQNYYFDEV